MTDRQIKAEAHCDGPCGVYDPSSIRVAAEAVLSITKKIHKLECPGTEGTSEAHIAFQNTLARFIRIKEEQAELAKREILILWTDYFKPVHLEKFPNLHETFWNAAKLCSSCKQECSVENGEALMAAVKEIHTMFWQSKDRDIAWYMASA